MKKMFYALGMVTALLFTSQKMHSQQNRNEEIIKTVSDYFLLERENIHVQFDKSVFMTNENIWFKGYVFHRKKNVPFFTTINIYASLIDDQGKILETKLLYGNIGSFTGNFKLGSNYKSGKYYLQFYTNWMNNFVEDESAVYEVAVINPATGAGNAIAKADPSKIKIDFKPEGGTYLSGVQNTIGIHISDCNNNPTSASTVDILDASGKMIKKVQINKLGYGKFDLPANTPDGYKAVVNIEDKKHEKNLPSPEFKGVAVEVNNYAVADKTIIKVRTNKASADLYAGKPLYMVIHQDEKAIAMELNLNNAEFEQTLVIPNSDFADGMNTIRILDTDLKQISERLFYKYPKDGLTANLAKASQTVDKINYKGKVSYPNMNLSVTVLPENTISFDDTNDIYGSFLLLPYIDSNVKASGRHYFTTLSKGKLYELDLFLMSQKSKYQWYNILQNTPKSNYPFDMGVTLRGSIPGTFDTQFAKVRLYSVTSGIDETADVNDKREFLFNNLIIPDSSYVNFTLLKKGAKPKELTLAPQILNVNRKYNKPYKPEPHFYESQTTTVASPNIFIESTELEEVTIEGTRLKYANTNGNGNLTGYKISEVKANQYQNLLAFIKTYGGFNVDDRDGNLTIYTRTKNSMNAAQAGPIIYMDNVQLVDFSMLSVVLMDEVDEIYMSSTAIVPSVRNYIGMIKIYLKKGARPGKGSGTPEIIIKNSFEKPSNFQNVTYNMVDDKGFENFGLIDWEPNIMTDENGEFNLEIPKISAKPIKILIEGFSADGKLISEIKTIGNK